LITPKDPGRRILLRQALATAALFAFRSRAANEAGADDLLDHAHALLMGLHAHELAPFLEEWPAVSERRSPPPSSVPVLRWLPEVRRSAPMFSAELVGAVVEAASRLAWRRSYSLATVGEAFYENYGWTEFAGLTGPVSSKRLACGVLLLGPRVTYPPHRHEAEEIYVPLAGTAKWRRGNESWRELPPGNVIRHARHESHAMQTGSEPLLALYLWRSRNLAQSSHLDSPQA
jgi:mannose-6-phosphate isomerase-like protein (cupin superfamily)